jgi:putative hydrolase of the HAD superfamily
MSIRAVFFDFGGVIMRTEYQAPRQKLAERFNLDYDEIDKAVFGSDSARRASLGEISEEAHWAAILKRFKQPASETKAFHDQFFGGDVLDRHLIEYIRSLRGSLHIGLISNAWSGLRALLVRENLLALFDTAIISAEVGMVKPSAEIYELALRQAGVTASESVFVDDMPLNIDACEKVGMTGILFRNSETSLIHLNQVLKVNQ